MVCETSGLIDMFTSVCLKKGSEGVESCSPGWPGELDLTGIDDEEIDKVVIATPYPILWFTPSK